MLTESDRADCLRVSGYIEFSECGREYAERLYLAGLRAGLLRAAAEIEHISPMTRPSGCVLLIRALAEL